MDQLNLMSGLAAPSAPAGPGVTQWRRLSTKTDDCADCWQGQKAAHQASARTPKRARSVVEMTTPDGATRRLCSPHAHRAGYHAAEGRR